MKLYVTWTSPYARVARIVVHEKGLTDRVEVVEAKTRTPDSPYYAINPAGRVPFLVRDDGVGMEDSGVISAYLDAIDGNPTLALPPSAHAWAYGRLEAWSRSITDGISVWVREMRRPANERSPTIIAHEAARAERLADLWVRELAHPVMQGAPNLAQFMLLAGIESAAYAGVAALETTRPELAAWANRLRERASVKATAPPPKR
ncbi:MAG: glutathione S-transferase family protein [Hyphomicrobiaceae bacterium]